MLSKHRKALREMPAWVLVGAAVFASCCAVLWRVELGALRSEVAFIGRVRSELLNKRFKNGERVSKAMVPGAVTVLRNDDGYFVCGKVKKEAQDWVR